MDVSPTIHHLHGRIRTITGTDPAAGAELTETVPARRRWKILSLQFRLVTAAGGAVRTMRLLIDDGTSTFMTLYHSNTQAEGINGDYFYYHSSTPESLHATTYTMSLPPILLTAGYRIRTDVIDLQAGDNIGAPVLLIEEWIDP